MPRPKIDDDIVSEIRQIHKQTQGTSASNFQEALDTVVQLAHKQLEEEPPSRNRSEGWYPGKYASLIVDSVVSDFRPSETTQPRGEQKHSSLQPDSSGERIHRSPETAAIFKTRYQADGEVTIPEAEADALGFETDEILQIIAYSIGEDE